MFERERKKIFLLTAFLLTALSFFTATPPIKNSLLVVQLDPKSSVNHLQHLVSYQFEDGKNISRDTILSVAISRKDVKGDYVRFDIGKNKIYRNRYIVTGIGNIIDIKNKKLLLDQKDQFVKFSGDSIIFYTNDIFKGKYYSVYDLKKEKYSQIENAAYKAIVGGSAEVDYSAKPFKMWMYDINDKRELLVEDAGDIEVKGKNQNSVPLFWISETGLLYAKTSTGGSKTRIFKVNTDKTKELIGEIDQLQYFGNLGFYKYDEDNIIFSSPKVKYKIDVAKKLVTKLSFISVGNKFYAELDEDPHYGRKIKNNDAEIGKYFCNISNIKSNEKMVALSYEMAVMDERYPQGIMLWDRDTKAWKSLDAPDVSSVIGWIIPE